MVIPTNVAFVKSTYIS